MIGFCIRVILCLGFRIITPQMNVDEDNRLIFRKEIGKWISYCLFTTGKVGGDYKQMVDLASAYFQRRRELETNSMENDDIFFRVDREIEERMMQGRPKLSQDEIIVFGVNVLREMVVGGDVCSVETVAETQTSIEDALLKLVRDGTLPSKDIVNILYGVAISVMMINRPLAADLFRLTGKQTMKKVLSFVEDDESKYEQRLNLCYANSAMRVLRRAFRTLPNLQSSDEFIEILLKEDVQKLAQAVGFRLGEQMDPSEMIQKLVNKYESLRELVECPDKYIFSCAKHKVRLEERRRPMTLITMHYENESYDIARDLEIFKLPKSDNICTGCNGTVENQECRVEYINKPLLIIYSPRPVRKGKNFNKIDDDVENNTLKPFEVLRVRKNAKYVMKSFLCFIGTEYNGGGHYVAYGCKTGEEWYKYDAVNVVKQDHEAVENAAKKAVLFMYNLII